MKSMPPTAPLPRMRPALPLMLKGRLKAYITKLVHSATIGPLRG
jgi:hypothetical protein